MRRLFLLLALAFSASLLAPGALAQSWSALDSGVNNTVWATVVAPNGDLYVAGTFTSAGGQPASRIAKWDGSSWSALGSGLSSSVYSMAMAPSGDLYVGGAFRQAGGQPADYVAKWDGTSWSALGSGLDQTPFALATDSAGNLYAGGQFFFAGGQFARGVAKWDGTSWSALGTGIENGSVRSLAIDGAGDLYVGGQFTRAGGQSVHNIAKWDGTSWSALGSGLNRPSGGPWAFALVFSSTGDLYAGGLFTHAGSGTANNVAKWDGTSWSPLGPGTNNYVYSLALDGANDLYVGGTFTRTQGSTPMNRIAKWNGTSWSPLGSGMNVSVTVDVLGLAFDGTDNLYAAGTFTEAGGQPASRVARWDGATPTPPPPFQVTGTEGWRTLALPYANLPLGGRGAGFLTNMYTAGYKGADRDQRNARGEANVFLYDEPSGAFVPPPSETSIAPGQGFWVHVVADGDPFPGTSIQSGFPKDLDVTGGTAVTGDVALAVTYTASAPTGPLPGGGGDYPGPGVNLAGNPYPVAIDWDHPSWTKTNVSGTVYVYDPAYNGGDYRSWNGATGDLTDGIIPAGQGFHVVATAENPVLVVTEAAKSRVPGVVYGKDAPAPLGLGFRLTGTVGESERESAAWLSLRETAALGLDGSDGHRLAGTPGADALRLYTVVPSGHPGAGSALAIGSVPSDLGGPVEIPFHAEALAGGSASSASARLSWEAASLPEGWTASLRDRQTGATYDLAAPGALDLALDAESALTVTEADRVPAWQKSAAPLVPVLPAAPRALTADPTEARFAVVLTPSGEAAKTARLALEVGEVGPNPAAVRAALPLTVGSASHVSVQVYDALGRLVATAQEGTLAAGTHAVALPVADLAAGTYLVHVESGSETAVRRLTIVR